MKFRNTGEAERSDDATHSPMVMAYPNAQLLRMTKYGLDPMTVWATDHYKVMRRIAVSREKWGAIVRRLHCIEGRVYRGGIRCAVLHALPLVRQIALVRLVLKNSGC